MAEPLKNFFDAEIVRSIARDLHGAYPAFRKRAFTDQCMAGLGDLELLARGWHIAEVMHQHLPNSFAAAAEILIASLGPEHVDGNSFGMAPFRFLPHVLFVQKYGLEDFEIAMRAQYELTKRFSAESSIRAFLVRDPERTYARLVEWARDGNVHVRRLVSEGTRPRLPWAPRLRAFQQDPRPVIALLEMLKDDPERYVQRSVANNLNDIGKDHPDLAVEVCRRWSIAVSPGRAWIVKHALRSLVKKGHGGALALMGADAAPKVRIDKVRLSPRNVVLGGRLRMSFEIVSAARTAQTLIVDYAVHFVKANGTTNRKVFKLRRLELPAAGRVQLASAVSFADLTTRRHYPGGHRLEALINGAVHPLAAFDVRPRARSTALVSRRAQPIRAVGFSSGVWSSVVTTPLPSCLPRVPLRHEKNPDKEEKMANDRRRRDEHGWEEDQRGRREGRDYGSERYAGQRFGSEAEERGADWARSGTERDWGRREEFGRGREYGRGYDRDQDYEGSERPARSYGRQYEDQGYPDYSRQSGGLYGRPESGEGSSRTFSRQYEDQGYPSYSRQSRGMYGQPEGGRGFEQTYEQGRQPYGQGREFGRNWTDEGRLQGYGFGQSTHSGKGPKGYSRSDDRIREDVCDRLTEDPRIDASEVDVKVSNCEVTLAGTVDSREAKRRAEDCAESVSGVRNVQNNIRVHQGGTTTQQARSKT